jgi:DNA-binding Lrp family transcriptional regulator
VQHISQHLDNLTDISAISCDILCTMPTLDRLDAALLGELSREPRVSIVELARRVGVARGTAQARFDRLQASGVIVGMGPEIDPAAIGYPVIAFTTLDTNQADLPALVSHLSAIPEVLEAHTISGPGDVLCRIAARSNQHLQEVISRVLAGPTIQRASTHIVLSTQVRHRTTALVTAAST